MPLNIGGGDDAEKNFHHKNISVRIQPDRRNPRGLSVFFQSRVPGNHKHLKSRRRQFKNHTGSFDGVHRTKWRARWQIIGMLVVGGGIVGLFVYLSLAG